MPNTWNVTVRSFGSSISKKMRRCHVPNPGTPAITGIACEVAPSPSAFGKQIRFADRRSIPFVVFPGIDGGAHQVKDIRSGEQVDLDPESWTPPEADLRPTVVAAY